MMQTLNKNIPIVYMGTPEFAVAPLKLLVDSGYNIAAVVTAPDKPAGRGQKLQQSAVKQYAQSVGLPVLQPVKLRDDEFLSALRSYNAELFIVVAFRMMPEVVWRMPKYGTFNLHASLLPQYRGAAPINWAIINGDKFTGVTTFFINEEIDSGDIIDSKTVEIAEDDNVGTLHDKLMKVGAELVKSTVDIILQNKVERKTQSEEKIAINNEIELKAAPKIFKQTCRIDWTKSAKEIYNFIRGLSPYPTAWCEFENENGETISAKIFTSKLVEGEHDLPSATIDTDGKTYFRIACKNGFIDIIEIQLAGKKRLTVRDFLAGLHGKLKLKI